METGKQNDKTHFHLVTVKRTDLAGEPYQFRCTIFDVDYGGPFEIESPLFDKEVNLKKATKMLFSIAQNLCDWCDPDNQ